MLVVCVYWEHSLAALARVSGTVVQVCRDTSFLSCAAEVAAVCLQFYPSSVHSIEHREAEMSKRFLLLVLVKS